MGEAVPGVVGRAEAWTRGTSLGPKDASAVEMARADWRPRPATQREVVEMVEPVEPGGARKVVAVRLVVEWGAFALAELPA